MAAPCWVLRCCPCRRFQAQQAKRSGKWSCSVCGQRQTVQKVYSQGSGLDCRHHVQKLNLLQGEVEEAIGWTSGGIEESINDSKNTGAQREDGLVQQEGRAEVSRWSKYLDKESEYQEDGEEAAGAERFCSQRKNTVEEQREQQKGFLSSDVQEYAEEHGALQLSCQVKKVKTSERKKCLVEVPDQDDGDALSGDRMVPAVCESVVPGNTTQTPAPCTKSSKWEKFLLHSDSYSRNAARVTLSPPEGSGMLGLPSTTAVGAGGCSEQAGRALPPGTGFEFKKSVASTEQVSSKLPHTTVPSSSCSVVEEVSKEPLSHVLRAGSVVSETAAGRCCLDSPRRKKSLVDCNTRPQPCSVSCEHLFCTGEEFDDDL